MKSFQGSECPICHKSFQENDDVAVCPVCGTPQHRACYLALGHCAKEDQHANMRTKEVVSQGVTLEEPTMSNGEITCPHCGVNNPKEGLFCESCGASLHGNTQQNTRRVQLPQQTEAGPFPLDPNAGMKPEEKLDGIKVKELSAFVGSNASYFLLRFQKFAKKKSVSMNLCALLFPSIYYCYRKIYLAGGIFLTLDIAVVVCNLFLYWNVITSGPYINGFYYAGGVLSIVMMLLGFLSGLFANFLYYQKARKKIVNQRKRSKDEAELLATLKKKGSVSPVAATIALILLTAAMMVAMSFTVFLV